MNMLRNLLTVGLVSLLTSFGFATTGPTLHASGEHHYAMLLVPPSDHPVTVKVTDGHQQVFLHRTLDAAAGSEERIDFSWMDAGHYYLEVSHEGRTFYKTVYVRPDRVGSLDRSITFQTTSDGQL